MHTLLLRLVGPMQSWGTISRFDERDTGKEPSKSGVLGLLAAAMGIDREDWSSLEPLAGLSMAVRHDRPGVLRTDYQTAACATSDIIIKADGSKSKDGVVSTRQYLSDAAFLVGLQGHDRDLLARAHDALKDPVWPLALGRKSYVPSEPVYIPNGLVDEALDSALSCWPWLGCRNGTQAPDRLLMSYESTDGTGVMRMDQPLSSFALRKFGARFVVSRYIDLSREESNVTA